MKKHDHKPGWYYRLSTFFRALFGGPVYKIPLDAGFSCPNRDGRIGRGGCSYCYNPAFSPAAGGRWLVSIGEQLEKGKKRKSSGRERYIAYFQAYTSTYGPVEELRCLYDEALKNPAVVGLSVATRPDCVPDQILDLLEDYARRTHVWVEYGLQSAHNATLAAINRGHTFEQFIDAVERTRGRGIYVCAHVILGLPGETKEMMLRTMAALNRCRIDGIKFHHLQVIKGTPLYEQYRRGEVPLFNNFGEYLPLICDCLELLSPTTVIHRLAARVTDGEMLAAPHWSESPTQIASAVEAELKRRGTWQGVRYEK